MQTHAIEAANQLERWVVSAVNDWHVTIKALDIAKRAKWPTASTAAARPRWSCSNRIKDQPQCGQDFGSVAVAD